MSFENIISIIIVVAAICAATALLMNKFSAKRKVITFARKKCLRQVVVLLDVEEINKNYKFTAEEERLICSLTIEEWEHWRYLIQSVKKVAQTHTLIFDDFVYQSFPQLKTRRCVSTYHFRNSVNKRDILIESMTMEELSLIASETEEVWAMRRKQYSQVEKIKRDFSNGYAIYCEVRKKKSPSVIDIIRDQKSIAGYQESYDRSLIYDGWEEEQKDFGNTYYGLCIEYRENDGRFTHQVKFNHIDKYGKMIESEFMVWEGFISSYSYECEDLLPEDMIRTRNNLQEWKNRERYYYNRVYDGLFSIIEGLSSKMESKPLVVFINSSKYSWEDTTYKYHYKYLQKTLKEKDYEYIDIESINNIGNDSVYESIVIIDLITHNDDLKNNCRIVAEFFSKHQPYIAYYSHIKEYTKQEVERFYKKKKTVEAKNTANSELQEIVFVKNLVLKVNKNSYFSYMAVTNTLIGQAAGADTIKAVWLDNPSKYHFKTGNSTETIIIGSYSVDSNLSYIEFSMSGNYRSADDIAKYTFKLFQKMGIWDQFKIKGENAINRINSLGLLSHQ